MFSTHTGFSDFYRIDNQVLFDLTKNAHEIFKTDINTSIEIYREAFAYIESNEDNIRPTDIIYVLNKYSSALQRQNPRDDSLILQLTLLIIERILTLSDEECHPTLIAGCAYHACRFSLTTHNGFLLELSVGCYAKIIALDKANAIDKINHLLYQYHIKFAQGNLPIANELTKQAIEFCITKELPAAETNIHLRHNLKVRLAMVFQELLPTSDDSMAWYNNFREIFVDFWKFYDREKKSLLEENENGSFRSIKRFVDTLSLLYELKLVEEFIYNPDCDDHFRNVNRYIRNQIAKIPNCSQDIKDNLLKAWNEKVKYYLNNQNIMQLTHKMYATVQPPKLDYNLLKVFLSENRFHLPPRIPSPASS